MRISDWSSDVCSSDLVVTHAGDEGEAARLVLRIEGVDQPQQHVGLGGRPALHADRVVDAAHELDVSLLRLARAVADPQHVGRARSEEHTSELQSLMRISYAVFCLKKKTINNHAYIPT